MKYSEGDAFMKEAERQSVRVYFIIKGTRLDPGEAESYYERTKVLYDVDSNIAREVHTPEIKVGHFEGWVRSAKQIKEIPEHHPIDEEELPKRIKEAYQ